MKNFDQLFGSAARVVGPTIRNLGEKLGFSLYELRNAITNSMHDYGYKYADETVNGFLYGRPWPIGMTRDATIEIVGRAFEQILIEQNKSDKIPEAKEILSITLNDLCETYEKEEIDSALKKVVAEFVFISEVTEYNPLLNKYFNACCSLTENDIAFLEIIADWTPEEKKTRYRDWSTKKIDFQTIASPAFRQWLSIFGKNFSEQFQKKKTENKKQEQAFRNFTQHLDKMTDKEIYSLLYLYQRLKDFRELNKKEAKKYPFGPPEQIGLLLQFKYCLSTSEQKSVLEHEMDATKAAGDH